MGIESSDVPIKTNNPVQSLLVLSLILVYTIVVGIAFTLLGLYLASRDNIKDSPILVSKEGSDMVKTILPTEKLNNVTKDWMEKYIPRCGVTVQVPPKQAPYYVPYNSNLSIEENFEKGFGYAWEINDYQNNYSPFSEVVSINYFSPNDPSEDIWAGINLFCSPNTDKLNTDNLMGLIESKYKVSQKEGIIPDPVEIIEKKESIYWGRKVFVFKTSGGLSVPTTSYIFTTPDYIYQVVRIVSTPKQHLTDTLDQILQNLRFD